MAIAGPSAAAISLAAIPLIVLFTGGAALGTLITATVEGVTASFSYVATSLGFVQKLPFASKYRSKAISAAKSQAGEAKKFAGEVVGLISAKGGPKGVMEEWKKRYPGDRIKEVELPEQPISVHDITGVEPLSSVFTTEGPKGWKPKRLHALKSSLEECKISDKGWYAGREPVLRIVGGPRIVEVENPLPKHRGEKRMVLEFWPLRLEKVVSGEGGILVEEVLAQGQSQGQNVENAGGAKGGERQVEEKVRLAAEAMRE